MKEKLIMLKNTLSLISTSGKDTLIMADSIRYLEQIINNLDAVDKTDSE